MRSARARRVTLMVMGLIILGLADLAFTLTYMRSVGMIELNPLAREMVAIGGARQLITYKLFTIALSAGIIYLIRHRRQAERCAWICCGVMLGLTFHWLDYNNHVLAAFAQMDLATMAEDPRWVVLMD